MRSLDALEIKKSVMVNQVSPTQSTSTGCTYYQVMNHVFEECPVFLAHQVLPEYMNVAFARPNNNPYLQTYNPIREITQISYRTKTPMINLGPTFPIISNHLIINKIFLIKFHHLLSKLHKWIQDSLIWKESWILSARPKKH